MQTIFARILDNALIVAALLLAAGAGLAGIGLDEPAVVAFLLGGILLIFRSGQSPAGRSPASQA